MAVAVVLAGLFIAVERRVPEPILPFSLLRRGTVTASVLCIAASGASMFMVIAALPLYAQGVVGLSATAAGVALIPMLLGMAVAAFLGGQVMVRLGRTRPTAAIGSGLLAGPLRGELANALRLGFWVAAGLEAAAFLVVVFVLEEVSWQPPGEPMLGVG